MKSKKYISLFLAVLMLVSNVGMAFTLHFCGGKIASISIQTLANSADTEKGCCAKKAVANDSCCKNKTVHFQKKSDNATLKAFSFEPFTAFLFFENKEKTVALPSIFINKTFSTYYCDAHAPPLFKLYHQFIFYA